MPHGQGDAFHVTYDITKKVTPQPRQKSRPDRRWEDSIDGSRKRGLHVKSSKGRLKKHILNAFLAYLSANNYQQHSRKHACG